MTNAGSNSYCYDENGNMEYRDLTTGSRTEASYLLTQGNIRLVLTTGLTADHPAQEEVRRYGDGIKDLAFTVADATAAWEQAIKNGAEPAYEPRETTDENGTLVMAGVETYGRVVHSFVSRTGGYGSGLLWGTDTSFDACLLGCGDRDLQQRFEADTVTRMGGGASHEVLALLQQTGEHTLFGRRVHLRQEDFRRITAVHRHLVEGAQRGA